MLRRGYDWSGSFPGVNQLKAGGGSFVGRYSVDDHPRGITAWELEAFTAAGLDIITFWESSAGWMLEGFNAGVAAAQDHLRVCRAAGQLYPVPMFAACDFDAAAASDLAAIANCLDGTASVLGRNNTGIYGGVLVVDAMRKAGKAAYGCETLAWMYREPNVGWSALAQVHQDGFNQYPGGTATNCDSLTAVAVDFGQWRRPTPQPDPVDNALNPHQFDKEPILKPGATGDPVKTAQFVLAVFDPKLKVTGTFDAYTENSVKNFQYLHGIPTADGAGIIGRHTWAQLASVVQKVHRYDWLSTTALKAGSTGPAVTTWQKALNAAGAAPYTPLGGAPAYGVDGAFGPRTASATVRFQQNRGLVRDGVVGADSWLNMGRLLTAYGR